LATGTQNQVIPPQEWSLSVDSIGRRGGVSA
jgi:hypothetical protein